VSSERYPFRIGQAIPLREGKDVLFVTTGVTTQRALQAADLLRARGIEAAVLHVHTVKPLDVAAILERASQVRGVIAVEEHTVNGGLGSATAEVLAESGVLRSARFARVGFPDVFTEEFGSQDQIMAKYGMNPEALADKAASLV
jgi:transketolase